MTLDSLEPPKPEQTEAAKEAAGALRMDHSHSQTPTPHSVFELETIGDQGYDDRVIVPGPGMDFGRVMRCLIGAGWALVTIQLLAWWILRADPAELAQYVPPQAAFILPDELRPKQPVENLNDSNSADLIVDDDTSIADDLQIETPERVSVDNAPPAPKLLTVGSADEPADVEATSAATANSSDLANDAFPSNALSTNDDLVVATSATSDTELTIGAAGGAAVPDYIANAARPPRLHPESIFIGNGPRWTDNFAKEDVVAAVAAAKKASHRFDQANLLATASPDELKKVAKLYYAVACNLAERSTMVNQEGAVDSLNRSREFLQDLRTDRTKVRMFANAARNWMNRRLGKGVVFSAKVTSIRSVGDLFELNTQLLDHKRTFVTVVTRTNPSDNPWTTFAVGDQILLAGVIVEDPEVRLPGYLGSDLWVVYTTDQIVRLP